MIHEDRQALICDLAETYRIFDYRSLPMRLVATLSVGLREDSRIMMKLSKRTAPFNTILLAEIADRLGVLINGKQPSARLTEQFFIKENKSSDVKRFGTVDEFNEARDKILRGN